MFESTGRSASRLPSLHSIHSHAPCSREGEGYRDGGRQVPPMRAALAL